MAATKGSIPGNPTAGDFHGVHSRMLCLNSGHASASEGTWMGSFSTCQYMPWFGTQHLGLLSCRLRSLKPWEWQGPNTAKQWSQSMSVDTNKLDQWIHPNLTSVYTRGEKVVGTTSLKPLRRFLGIIALFINPPYMFQTEMFPYFCPWSVSQVF